MTNDHAFIAFVLGSLALIFPQFFVFYQGPNICMINRADEHLMPHRIGEQHHRRYGEFKYHITTNSPAHAPPRSNDA